MSIVLADDYAQANTAMTRLKQDSRLESLQLILKRCHSNNGNEQSTASLELSETLQELQPFDLKMNEGLFGPLAHALTKLFASKDKQVVANALSATKVACCDGNMKRGLMKAGICNTLISLDLSREQALTDERLAVAQNMLFDEDTAKEFAQAGGLRCVSEALNHLGDFDIEKMGTSNNTSSNNNTSNNSNNTNNRRRNNTNTVENTESLHVALCCATNALAHCDTSLSGVSHEMRVWITLLVDICEKILAKQIQTQYNKQGGTSHSLVYAVSALTNATRDPGLAHAIRASNGIDVLERCKNSDAKSANAAGEALTRLDYKAGLRRNETLPILFAWGRKNKSLPMTNHQIAGMAAFLLIVTSFAGFIVLVLFGVHDIVT
jgi:hypothetical protein